MARSGVGVDRHTDGGGDPEEVGRVDVEVRVEFAGGDEFGVAVAGTLQERQRFVVGVTVEREQGGEGEVVVGADGVEHEKSPLDEAGVSGLDTTGSAR